jgi:hypothetical protein
MGGKTCPSGLKIAHRPFFVLPFFKNFFGETPRIRGPQTLFTEEHFSCFMFLTS